MLVDQFHILMHCILYFLFDIQEKSVNLRKVDTTSPKLEINHPGIEVKLSPIASRGTTCSKSQSILPSGHSFPTENTLPPCHDFRIGEHLTTESQDFVCEPRATKPGHTIREYPASESPYHICPTQSWHPLCTYNSTVF